MFKNTHTSERAYGEVGQPNNLRWQIYYKDGDVYHSQSHIIKCRDFFNDVIAHRNKVKFSIYGFDPSNIKFNDEGLYMLLTHVSPLWKENVLKALSPEMEKTWGKSFVFSEHAEGVLILIPNEALENTYLISLFTLVIRLCNYDIPVESFEDCFKGPLSIDNAVPATRVPAILKYRFTIPEKSKGYWWYTNDGTNNKSKDYGTRSGYIHNCGVSSWLSTFLKEV